MVSFTTVTVYPSLVTYFFVVIVFLCPLIIVVYELILEETVLGGLSSSLS